MSYVTIVDGGFSTQLARVTDEIIDGDPLWTARYLATNPEAVLKTHLDYLNAGAEVIITNSYQASISGFMTHLGLDEKASYELIKESVRIARRAVNIYLSQNKSAVKPKIAGSIGPYGACLCDGSEYTGTYMETVDINDIIDWHRPRITALMEEGVDFFAIETIPALSEAEALLTLMKSYPQQKMWLSFQCKDDSHIAHGESFKDAVKRCWEVNQEQLIAVGCNCMNPKFVKNLLSSARDVIQEEKPFVVYPNSGEDYSSVSGWSGKTNSSDLTELIDDWLKLGVKYIGGCCRTDTTYVAAVKDMVNKWHQSQSL